MAPKNRISREQKGKALAFGLSLVRDEIGAESPVDDFNLIHRDALMDTASLSVSQREGEGQAPSGDGSDGEEEYHSIDIEDSPSEEHHDNEERPSEEHVEPVDFYPIRFYPGGIFERQEAIPSDQLRPLIVEGQNWGKTMSTYVKRLFRECGASGVTFLISNDKQQPWTPSLGYQCGYVSYFRKDTKLWFPFPRLITSYCFRCDVAISQFINGSFRIAVALMTMVAEANISMSVRTFEEQTITQPRPHKLFFVNIRPSYNIITGHPNKIENWNHYYFYVKSDEFTFEEPPKDDYRVLCNNKLEKFFENAQAIAALSHLRWPDISWERIHRVIEWISGVGSGNKRLQLFPKPKHSRVKKMRKMSDLSALVGGELGMSGDNPMAILDVMNSEAPVTDLISSLEVPQNPEECKGDDVDWDGGDLAPLMNEAIPQTARMFVESGKKNLLRKTHAKFSDRVSFCYSADAPLISDAHSCTKLVCQIIGGPSDMPQVSDDLFNSNSRMRAKGKTINQRLRPGADRR
ncbi:hypothetical protein N665_0599s0001 [Sinapis alba]|nr:hypothetical protein N665_0599s0001 [Sinapis alba]